MDTPRPSLRTNRTRRVPHPVLIGHAAAQVPSASRGAGRRISSRVDAKGGHGGTAHLREAQGGKNLEHLAASQPAMGRHVRPVRMGRGRDVRPVCTAGKGRAGEDLHRDSTRPSRSAERNDWRSSAPKRIDTFARRSHIPWREVQVQRSCHGDKTPETCPVSTGGGTRRVRLVREGGRGVSS